jgi:hypothetical protein
MAYRAAQALVRVVGLPGLPEDVGLRDLPVDVGDDQGANASKMLVAMAAAVQAAMAAMTATVAATTAPARQQLASQ